MTDYRTSLYGFVCALRAQEQMAGHSGNTIANMLLEHGREFMVRSYPPDLERMAPKRCYENSLKLALRYPDEFTYCEGYVVTKLAPIPHAWCADEDGQVIDATLPDPEWREYWGVPFKLSFAAKYQNTRGLPILWDWQAGFPVLHTPVKEWLAGEFLAGRVRDGV